MADVQLRAVTWETLLSPEKKVVLSAKPCIVFRIKGLNFFIHSFIGTILQKAGPAKEERTPHLLKLPHVP